MFHLKQQVTASRLKAVMRRRRLPAAARHSSFQTGMEELNVARRVRLVINLYGCQPW
jgi:hypothetical protein